MRTKKPKKGNGNGKSKAGRPTLYDPENTPRIVYEACKQFGARDIDLCPILGITEPTFYHWKKTHPEFDKALRKGKDEHDGREVESALLKRAKGYTYEEIKEEEVILRRGRGSHGVRVPAMKVSTIVKEIPPDPQSIIFYLANRNPERWKHIQKVEATGSFFHDHEHGGSLKIDNSIERTAEVLDILRASGVFSTDSSPGSDSKTH